MCKNLFIVANGIYFLLYLAIKTKSSLVRGAIASLCMFFSTIAVVYASHYFLWIEKDTANTLSKFIILLYAIIVFIFTCVRQKSLNIDIFFKDQFELLRKDLLFWMILFGVNALVWLFCTGNV